MKNIAILFPVSRKMGVFQYALSIAEAVASWPDVRLHILYFASENPKEFLKVKNVEAITFTSLDSSSNGFVGKIKFFANIFLNKPLFVVNEKNSQIVKKMRLDLIILPFPILFGFENSIPYIVAIPDIMHRHYPNFPEYSLFTRIKRDFVYATASKNALVSIVDAKCGAQDLHAFYDIAREKIEVIPYIPPGYIYDYKDMTALKAQEILKKYHLPEKFIFYPAQFWFHKNHIRLVRAIGIIKEKYGAAVNLVFSGNPGANDQNYKKVVNLAKTLGVESQLHFLGYVSDLQMVALYKTSLALVFPTLIGPTSIPPLEALVLGTPVLCSDLFGMPEQLQNAGLLFDPFDENDIAQKVYELWYSEALRRDLVANAQVVAQNITAQGFAKKWESVIKGVLNKAL